MVPVGFTVLALSIAFFSHLVLWRVRLPQAQLKTLLLVFLFAWFGAVIIAWLTDWRVFSIVESQTLTGFLYFCLFYWSAALCYVITYSAMEGDSPTLSLTRHLHRRGVEGVSHEEIEEFFRQRPLVRV